MASTPNPSKAATPAKCVECERPIDSIVFCDHCHTLFPADGRNHFELFGLEPKYDVDGEVLRRKYLELSRQVHPDRHGTGPDEQTSERLSAQLNEAQRVLRDPILRAEYLLELHGGPSSSEDKRVQDGVLTETLLLRDEIAEAKASGDEAVLESSRGTVHKTYDRIRAQVDELARQLPGDEQIRLELRATLNSIKYYQRLLAELAP